MLRIHCLSGIFSLILMAYSFSHSQAQSFSTTFNFKDTITKKELFRAFSTNNSTMQLNSAELLAVDKMKSYIPKRYDTDLIIDRLKCLENQIPLTYNHTVDKYIIAYTQRARENMKDIMTRAEFYFPIFEEVLKKNNMPTELKYLSIIESELKCKARSYAAAVGLWQFMPATGKQYGLDQDSYVDERCDPYEATEAACKYLKYLYEYFHQDWHLALAAYNCGEGRVGRLVDYVGKNDYWAIYDRLPHQTQMYVPKFIAAVYAFEYAKEHHIEINNGWKPIPSDTVLFNEGIHLSQIAEFYKIPLQELELLNPHLKQSMIPAFKSNYPLRVPAVKKKGIHIYREIVKGNYEKVEEKVAQHHTGKNNFSSSTKEKKKIYHPIAENESLKEIALRYQVALNDVKVWNKLTDDNLKQGQKLLIWVSDID